MSLNLTLAHNHDPARTDTFLEAYRAWAAETKRAKVEQLPGLLEAWGIDSREDMVQTYHAAMRFRARTPRQGSARPRADIQEKPAPTAQEITDLERSRRREQQAKEQAAILRKEAATRADLVDQIRDVIGVRELRPSVPPPAIESARSAGVLVLFVSDVHVGQLFERERGGGLGEYNTAVFEQRLTTLVREVLSFAQGLRTNGPINDVIVALGGDLLDGHDIHPGHDHEAIGIAEQLAVGPDLMSGKLIAPLAGAFARVHVVSVPGNHGRVGKKGQLDQVKDSLDLVFTDIMRRNCASLENVTWHPHHTWFTHFEVLGHTFFLAHGDSFKAWAGIPFYGAQRYLSRLQSMIHKAIDVLMVGHHHSQADFGHGMSNIVMNGSFPGTGTFGSWLGLSGLPMQTCFLVTPEQAIGPRYPIALARREDVLTLQPLHIA